MCKKDARTATLAEAANVIDNAVAFIVIRDVAPEDLHLKGDFLTANEAVKRAQDLAANGYKASIIAVHADGATDRDVLEVPLGTVTVVTGV